MPPQSTGRTRARFVVLALIAGWVLGGSSSASAQTVVETSTCAGGTTSSNAAHSGGSAKYAAVGSGGVVCTITGPAEVYLYGVAGRSFEVQLDDLGWVTVSNPGAGEFQALIHSFTITGSGSHTVAFRTSPTSTSGQALWDFYSLGTAAEPSPSPTPLPTTPPPTSEPTPSPTVEPTTEPTTPPPTTEPTQEPPPTEAQAVYLASDTAPDGTPVMVLHPQQFTALGVGLVLLVVLTSALLVSQLRRPHA